MEVPNFGVTAGHQGWTKPTTWVDVYPNGSVVTGSQGPVGTDRGAYVQTPLKGSAPLIRGFRKPTGYEKKVVSGAASSPCKATYLRAGGIKRTYTYPLSRGNQGFIGTVCNLGDFSSIESSLSASAIYRAAQDLRQYQVDYGKALAESRSTIALIALMFGRLARLISWVLRGKWSKVARDLGHRLPKRGRGLTPDSYWLEYQFGWRPLFSDLFGAIEDCKQRLGSKDHIVRSYGSDEAQVMKNLIVSIPMTLKSSCVLYARVKNANLAGLASAGLTNPIGIAWELVPFSFVVDWFLPIGDWLDALSSTHGLEFVSGSLTSRLFFELDEEIWAQPQSGTPLEIVKGSCSTKGIHMRRSVLTSFAIPFPRMSASPLTNTRAVTALALASQRVRRIRLLS